MVVRHDVALVVPNEAGTGARGLLGDRSAPEIDLLLGCRDEGDGRLRVAEKGDGRPFVLIEIAILQRRGTGLGLRDRGSGGDLLEVLAEIGAERGTQNECGEEDSGWTHGEILGFAADSNRAGKRVAVVQARASSGNSHGVTDNQASLDLRRFESSARSERTPHLHLCIGSRTSARLRRF